MKDLKQNIVLTDEMERRRGERHSEAASCLTSAKQAGGSARGSRAAMGSSSSSGMIPLNERSCFGSVDSSDTFLSCNTHPFPSQGSLAGLEELAATGTMAANGSMPAVNIPSFNGVYVNPFGPAAAAAATCHSPARRQSMLAAAAQTARQDSPSRRARIAAANRAASAKLASLSDNELDRPDEQLRCSEPAPKHKRARVSQSGNKPRPRFELDDSPTNDDGGAMFSGSGLLSSHSSGHIPNPALPVDAAKQSFSKGFTAALNQGLATLGSKIGKGHSKGSLLSSNEGLDTREGSSRKKSILKKSERVSECSSDPERENLLPNSSASQTPAPARKQLHRQPAAAAATAAADATTYQQLPPTTHSDLLKSLTGPKLKKAGKVQAAAASTATTPAMAAAAAVVNQNSLTSSTFTSSEEVLDICTRRVASKEIQTSNINVSSVGCDPLSPLPFLGGSKFERGHPQQLSQAGHAADLSSVPAVVPHCSNPLCRHNTPTTGGTVRVTPDTQKLICVCGRTMSMVALEVEQTKSCDQPPATTSFPHHPPSS